MAFAKAAVRKSRKLEAVKKEKVRALQTKLAGCQGGGGDNAECEALKAELGAASQELAEAETAAQFSMMQAQTAQGALDDANDVRNIYSHVCAQLPVDTVQMPLDDVLNGMLLWCRLPVRPTKSSTKQTTRKRKSRRNW
jgi:hypothetical protein